MKDAKEAKAKSFFTLFPTPEYLSLSAPGIVISDDAITFISFKRTLFTGALRLGSYKRSSLPEGVVKAGVISDIPRLVKALKKFSLDYGLSHVRAILPEEKVYLFTAHIDRVPAESLRDAVAFILEENVPIPLAEAVFYFDVLAQAPDSAKIKVIVSVLPKQVANDYLAAFAEAGMLPVAFDIESQAIARAIVLKGDKTTQLIVNLESEKTGFYVVEDEVVQFTTTVLGDIKTEMKKIFAFWSTRPAQPNQLVSQIEKVVVCGPRSMNSSMVEALMSECPVPYTLSNPWANLATGTESVPKDLLFSEQDYVAAIGSALSHH